MKKVYPVIYMLDDNKTCDVRYYCSVECRAKGGGILGEDGESADWIPGTVCENCGGPLREG